jgi:hypothetical protein
VSDELHSVLWTGTCLPSLFCIGKVFLANDAIAHSSQIYTSTSKQQNKHSFYFSSLTLSAIVSRHDDVHFYIICALQCNMLFLFPEGLIISTFSLTLSVSLIYSINPEHNITLTHTHTLSLSISPLPVWDFCLCVCFLCMSLNVLCWYVWCCHTHPQDVLSYSPRTIFYLTHNWTWNVDLI